MRVSISSAALKELVPDTSAREFYLVRMNLTAAACPLPYSKRIENQGVGLPIVVVRNASRAGLVASTGYIPGCVVAAGEDTRRRLMQRGVVSGWVWAEAGLNINCDDEISSEELSQKLQALLTDKFTVKSTSNGGGCCTPGGEYPWIRKIYPFEGYLIYDLKGQNYRQGFQLDPFARKVVLSGEPTKVEEKFVNASVVEQYQYPVPQTGLRPSPSVARPFALGVAWGSPNSELFLNVTRNWTNINEAAKLYVDATKTGLYKPMVPSFAPVKIGPDGHILNTVTAAGIAPIDFVCWSGTKEAQAWQIIARQFSPEKRKKLSKTGAAMKDGSFPIVTKKDLGNARQAFGRSPDKATKDHIVKRAKALGVKLSDNWKPKVAAAGKTCSACGATMNDEQQIHAGMCKACSDKHLNAKNKKVA